VALVGQIVQPIPPGSAVHVSNLPRSGGWHVIQPLVVQEHFGLTCVQHVVCLVGKPLQAAFFTKVTVTPYPPAAKTPDGPRTRRIHCRNVGCGLLRGFKPPKPSNITAALPPLRSGMGQQTLDRRGSSCLVYDIKEFHVSALPDGVQARWGPFKLRAAAERSRAMRTATHRIYSAMEVINEAIGGWNSG